MRTALVTSLVISAAVALVGLPGALHSSALLAANQETPPGLICIQNALGGTKTFASVSSLRITAETKPTALTGARPLPGTREISVVFPDRYTNVHTGRLPNGGTLGSTVGFDGRTLLSSPRVPDANASMRTARQDFVRQMLMWLPRTMAGVTFSQRVAHEAKRELLALDASNADGLQGTLLANATSCIPIALEYVAAAGMSGRGIRRIELSAYRTFSGIRFPTLLTTSHADTPLTEERTTNIEVNAPAIARSFAQAP